ncbi:MAG: SUMF1/EgtB/PvdO family nonheme iron enzyme [Planctomycetota bacterium]
MGSNRRLTNEQLCDALAAARSSTLARSLDLSDEQWVVPYNPYNQPTSWDLGHIGWFAEIWLLRGPHRPRSDGSIEAAGSALFFGDDDHYDSAVVCHADRWLPPARDRAQLLDALEAQLEAVQQRLRSDDSRETSYFGHLALYHECMHAEALAWTRATCGYSPPADAAMPEIARSQQLRLRSHDAQIGSAPPGDEFAFDNEIPQHAVAVGEVSIDTQLVRNDAFLAFVEDGGYCRRELWPEWRPRRGMPERWHRKPDGSILHRHYDQYVPLPLAQPVVHVNAFEAEAYCRWAGRRLPTAAEWEAASAMDGGMQWGHSVWEWTATTFASYREPFVPGPYVTYSVPWFHHQRELRGGAYTTSAVMHDRRYRNFFLAHRTDVFAGFRTVGDG